MSWHGCIQTFRPVAINVTLNFLIVSTVCAACTGRAVHCWINSPHISMANWAPLSVWLVGLQTNTAERCNTVQVINLRYSPPPVTQSSTCSVATAPELFIKRRSKPTTKTGACNEQDAENMSLVSRGHCNLWLQFTHLHTHIHTNVEPRDHKPTHTNPLTPSSGKVRTLRQT